MSFSNTSKKDASTRDEGNIYEDKAEKYLIGKNYEIVKRNFYFGRYGEIDIIAKHNNILVFVEVKSRKTDTFGHVLESLSPSKKSNLRRAAEGYLYVNKIENVQCRFDFIGFDLTHGREELIHIENAF